MSYILDALNKSEQARERKQTPGLKSLQGEAQPGRFQVRHFLSLLALLVIFNSIGIYLYFGDSFLNDPASTEQSVTEPVVSQSRPESIEKEALVSQEVSTAAAPVSVTLPVVSSPAVAISELPEHIIQRLPDIQINAHIFASDPDLRMVNINGISRQEGDLISQSLQLVEITELGVVLNFEGYAYVLNIVEDWQDNP